MRLLIIAISVFASAGVAWFYILPTWEASQERLEIRRQYDATLERIEDFVQKRDQLIQKLDSIPEEERERIAELLPRDIDTLRVLLRLDTIALEHDVLITDLSVESAAPRQSQSRQDDQNQVSTLADNPDPLRHNVNLSFTADYETLKAYLKDIEADLRLFDIVNLELATRGASSEDVRSNLRLPQNDDEYSYTMTIQTYTLN